jgi:hypothetical protein
MNQNFSLQGPRKMRSESISVCLGSCLFNCKWLLTKYAVEHTGRPVKDLQKCLVGDGSAGLRGWQWNFLWQEEFHKFPYQRLLWKWSHKDLKASIELLKKGSLKLVRIEVSRPVDLETTGLNRFIELAIKFIVSVLREDR